MVGTFEVEARRSASFRIDKELLNASNMFLGVEEWFVVKRDNTVLFKLNHWNLRNHCQSELNKCHGQTRKDTLNENVIVCN